MAYLFAKRAYHSLSDEHLWFSIFSRPPANQFTRTQRCTCCFVLLFTAMLLGIFYYDLQEDAKTSTTGGLALGPFYITREQVNRENRVDWNILFFFFFLELDRHWFHRGHSLFCAEFSLRSILSAHSTSTR